MLIILGCALPVTGSAFEEFCKAQYDGDRTEAESLACLQTFRVVLESAVLRLGIEAVLGQPVDPTIYFFFGQPVDPTIQISIGDTEEPLLDVNWGQPIDPTIQFTVGDLEDPALNVTWGQPVDPTIEDPLLVEPVFEEPVLEEDTPLLNFIGSFNFFGW